MFKLLLLHRLRSHARPESAIPEDGPYAARVGEVAQKLGLVRHTSMRMVGPNHPVSVGISWTRSRTVLGLLASGSATPLPWGEAPDPRLSADLLEELEIADDAGLAANASPSGLEEHRELARLREGDVEATSAMVCRHLAVVPGEPATRGCKLMFCLREAPGTTVEQMHEHWRNRHTSVVLPERGSLRFSSYEQLPTLEDEVGRGLAEALSTDGRPRSAGIAALSYPSVGFLMRTFISPFAHVANVRLIRDELKFIDLHASSFLLGRFHSRALG